MIGYKTIAINFTPILHRFRKRFFKNQMSLYVIIFFFYFI